jgi:hypothetical protein
MGRRPAQHSDLRRQLALHRDRRPQPFQDWGGVPWNAPPSGATMDGFVIHYISTFTGEIGRQPGIDVRSPRNHRATFPIIRNSMTSAIRSSPQNRIDDTLRNGPYLAFVREKIVDWIFVVWTRRARYLSGLADLYDPVNRQPEAARTGCCQARMATTVTRGASCDATHARDRHAHCPG